MTTRRDLLRRASDFAVAFALGFAAAHLWLMLNLWLKATYYQEIP